MPNVIADPSPAHLVHSSCHLPRRHHLDPYSPLRRKPPKPRIGLMGPRRIGLLIPVPERTRARGVSSFYVRFGLIVAAREAGTSILNLLEPPLGCDNGILTGVGFFVSIRRAQRTKAWHAQTARLSGQGAARRRYATFADRYARPRSTSIRPTGSATRPRHAIPQATRESVR